MAIKLPGVNYIPKVQQSSIKVTVTNSLSTSTAVVDRLGNITIPPVTAVSVNVTLSILNIDKSTATATVNRLFSQINKMANGNLPETPPTDAIILQGKLSQPAITDLELSVDESEEIPVCSIGLIIMEMRFDLLESKLAELLTYISSVLLTDI